MKVYRLRTLASVVCHPEDQPFLADEHFSGSPYPLEWKTFELILQEGTDPNFDFYGFGQNALVCSERASLYCSPMWDEGEFLPVKLLGLAGEYSLYNCTHCPSVLHQARTIWETSTDPTQPRTISAVAFHADRFDYDCVFKIPEDGARAIYALEHKDLEGHESLTTLVKRYGLTGLQFEQVWENKRGKRKTQTSKIN